MSRNINAELARPLWSWSAKARRAGGALLAKAKYPLCGVRSCWGVSVSVSRAEWGMSGSAVGRGPGASLQRVFKLLFRWGVNNQSQRAPRTMPISRGSGVLFGVTEDVCREKIKFHFQTFSPEGFIYLSGHVGSSSGVWFGRLYQAYSHKWQNNRESETKWERHAQCCAFNSYSLTSGTVSMLSLNELESFLF